MSKTHEAIKLAFRKGYRVTENGEVVNATGKVRALQIRRRRTDARYVFNIAIPGGRRFPVPVHKLQAYQKYGEDSLAEGIVARHLDGDAFNNRPDNIALGSVLDNIMDRPAVERSSHALKASLSQQHARTDWDLIEKDHRDGRGFKKLSQKYGVSKGSLSYHFSKIDGWKKIVPFNFDWEAIKAHIVTTGCDYDSAAKKYGCTSRSIRRKLGPRKQLK